MWSDERPFEGKHYRLERPFNLPQSLTRPHPPI
jgi:alkanesulfonate monooxygenase SsuD/methylene tetrahydromethanopterin reductase-like flavin-dependent oxidoreductase (luciferase family)